jgi:RNA polymerase sigma-70 factor (ECF subfamily)
VEDVDVAARYLEGDPEVVATLDRWLDRAARPYRRKLGHEWDDVLQDLRLEMVRLLRSGKFRGESSLKTYVWRAVGHSCIDRLRKQARRPEIPELPPDLPSTAPSPEKSVLRSESSEVLLRILGEMPLECRQLWAMILAGRSYDEMSRDTGVAAGTLRVRVFRCREKASAARDVAKRRERRLSGGRGEPCP